MKRVIIVAAAVLLANVNTRGDQLLIGTAAVSITPDKPISLAGQFHQRISKKVENPVTANIIALESQKDDQSTGHAIMISMDLVYSDANVQSQIVKSVCNRLPEINPSMVFTAGTHTHTGPTLNQDRFNDYGDAMQPKDYVPWMVEQVVGAIEKAWKARRPGAVAWGLGHTVIAENRRATYADGTAQMYGSVKRADFLGLEGREDHTVDVICFTDFDKKLIATAIAVPCPSQVVEQSYEVNADYWHYVRQGIKEKYGSDVVIAGFCGPAGDMTPRTRLRTAADERMQKLRNLSREAELGRRVVNAFDDVWAVIQQDLRSDVAFTHQVEQFKVPGYKLTEKEYEEAKKGYAQYAAQYAAKDEKDTGVYSYKRWYKRTIDRYESQERVEPEYLIQVHTVRIGDLVIATNPFELFQDFAMRIQGRSVAPQTMLIQLASPVEITGTYVPSARAMKGGGYSAVPQSNSVGPEGGDILVKRTLEGIRQVWDK